VTRFAATDRFIVSPSVRARELDDELILLDLQGGEYFSLNPTGRDVWDALRNGADLATVESGLASHWQVPPATAVTAIEELLRELLDRKLIARAP